MTTMTQSQAQAQAQAQAPYAPRAGVTEAEMAEFVALVKRLRAEHDANPDADLARVDSYTEAAEFAMFVEKLVEEGLSEEEAEYHMLHDADCNEYDAWVDCDDCNDDGCCSERCAAIAEALAKAAARRA